MPQGSLLTADLPAPAPHRGPWATLLLTALASLLLAAFLTAPASATLTIGKALVLVVLPFLAATVRKKPLDPARAQAAAIGTWAGPLALLAGPHPFQLLAALFLLGPALARLRAIGDPPAYGLYAAHIAALLFQLSLLTLANGHKLFAALGLCAAAFLAARSYWHRRSGQPPARYLTLLHGSALFAFLALAAWGGRGNANLSPSPEAAGEPASQSGGLGGDHNGLILHPKLDNLTTLVAPPSLLRLSTQTASTQDEFRIPFQGVYWIFRQPDTEPPPHSFQSEGDPESIFLRSMSYRPMRVLARQNFGRLIDLHCCARLRVLLRNGDPNPGTVQLELAVRDTRTPANPPSSLGRQPLRSALALSLPGNAKPIQESIDFPVPTNAPLFDEAILTFRLDPTRNRRAARVAVEAFVFLPRR